MRLTLSQKIHFGILTIVVLALGAVWGMSNFAVSRAIAQYRNLPAVSPAVKETSLHTIISFYHDLQITLVIITLAIGLVVFLFGIYLAKKIVEPIQNLVVATQKIANGNFSFKVPVTSDDEVGKLAISFNQMSVNLFTMLQRERVIAAEAASAETANRKAAELKLANEKILEKSGELQKINAELDSFVYIASHDLRAPLRGISSFATFLEEDYRDKLDEEGREYLSEIRRGANTLQDLIEDLLTLSRISRIRNPYELIAVKDLIDAGIERLRLYIKEHKAQVMADGPFPVIYCDRIKMTEVFVNLINNGIKFSSRPNLSDKQPCVEIRYDDKGAFHQFSVIDNGIGIDSKYHEQVFEIFKRLHASKDYEGTGAGLTIVKKIIEEHQGKIWIESKEGQGSKFIFTIAKELREKQKLGEILLKSGAITQETLDQGLKKQAQQE